MCSVKIHSTMTHADQERKFNINGAKVTWEH